MRSRFVDVLGPCTTSNRCIKVNALRFQLADLLEEEEEWSEAARVLMGISLDSGQRWVFCPELARYQLIIPFV